MSSQESWTVGSAMISVGTMGIIVGMIAICKQCLIAEQFSSGVDPENWTMC